MPGRRPAVWSNAMMEIMVSDFDRSLAFWRGVIGFAVAYDRPEQKFVYLERPEAGR